MGHPFQAELQIAKELARSAGEMAKLSKSSSRFSQKENDEGPVSEADLKADLMIREGLKTHFPNDLVISEETAKQNTFLPATGRVWLVDPIDGTADYVSGGLDYSVMIGLLCDGIPALGVVYEPETDEMWAGAVWREGDCFMRFAQRIQHDGEATLLDLTLAPQTTTVRPIVTISKHHPSIIADQIVKWLNPSQIIKKGSLGLKIALIADGKADFYVAASRRIKVWDTCAPFALLKAAGGNSYGFDGSDLIYGPTCTHDTPFFAVSHRFGPLAKELLSQHLGQYARI